MDGTFKGLFSRLLLTLPLAAFLAAGCTPAETEKETPANPAGTAEEAPRRGGTLVTGWTAEPNGVNELIQPTSQASSEVVFRLFLHLVEEQPDYTEHPPTMKPQLAKSWEWSPDHKTLTFRLREDAVWSDGVPITAEDVRWTWQAQIHPDVAWDNAVSKDAITDVEVVDPHTVRFHYSRPYSAQLLNANEGGILPKHAWGKLPFSEWRESADWFKKNLVVSGPFTVASWEPQQQLVLVRNDRYYDKKLPYLDRVVMRFISDQPSLIPQLLSGDLEFSPQITPADVPRIQASPRLQVLDYWVNLYVGIGWNNDHPLFSDPEVRRAITLATDRQAIVETLLGDFGKVAVSPVPSFFWAHDRSIKPWPYDPAEARRILAAKGWKDSDGDGILDKSGKPFAFEILTNAGNQLRIDAVVMIQNQLKKVGIQVEPRQVEWNTLVDRTVAGDFAGSIVGFSVDTSLDLTSSFSIRGIAEGANYMRYRNPEVDRLLNEALEQREMEQMGPYVRQVQQIIHREQPLTFLWESKRLSVIDRRVQDARPSPSSAFFNLQEWWVRPER
ncbi:MAG TPA: ABC transporter substrate-binding protein [Thermoanaerobaculia bacterium]|nr:ABC transporter substrate-binding protein [Thermoanaerobaculia bacterium]